MKRVRALIIDDETDTCEAVKECLADEGIDVEVSQTPYMIMDTLEASKPDVVILDQNMPGQKGTAILETLRNSARFKTIPVIMLTGLQDETLKINALDSGADDYVLKPFSSAELAARIRAVLRRVPSVQGPKVYNENGLEVDTTSHQIRLRGQVIEVTLTEFKIIFELVSHKNEVLSRDYLREMALGKSNVTDRTIDVHLAAVRKKLGDWANAIQTVRGVGYRYSG